MALHGDGVDRDSAARDGCTLARLIDPVDEETFRQEYWARQPLLVSRGAPGYFAELLTLADMDRVLSLSNVRDGDFRVVRDGKETPVNQLNSRRGEGGAHGLEVLYQHYREGSTVVVNALERRFAPLQRLAYALGTEITARIQANIYVTPAGNRGFKPHYDTHDVFICQVHGSKRWQLFGAPVDLPLRSQPHNKSLPEPTEPLQEFDLCDGDVLYQPRGTLHAGTSNDRTSVHMTLGVHPILWHDVFEEAMRGAAHDDVRFRHGLPLGFGWDEEAQRTAQETAAQLVAALAERLRPQELVEASLSRSLVLSPPDLLGHLADLEHQAEVGADTKVRRRAGLPFRLGVDGRLVNLDFHGKTVQLPVHVEPEVRYVAQSDEAGFTAADIRGELDGPGRLLLVRTLVREGFLTLAQDSDALSWPCERR